MAHTREAPRRPHDSVSGHEPAPRAPGDARLKARIVFRTQSIVWDDGACTLLFYLDSTLQRLNAESPAHPAVVQLTGGLSQSPAALDGLVMRQLRGRLGGTYFSTGHPLLQSRHQAVVHVLRDDFFFHPFEDLNGLLCGVADHPAVRAIVDVLFEMRLQLLVYLFIQIIIQFLEESLTSKQKRRLPSV